jgi:hypothetical protein
MTETLKVTNLNDDSSAPMHVSITMSYPSTLSLDRALDVLYSTASAAEDELIARYKASAVTPESEPKAPAPYSVEDLLKDIFGDAGELVGSIFGSIIRAKDGQGRCPNCQEYSTVSRLGLCSSCGEWV